MRFEKEFLFNSEQAAWNAVKAIEPELNSDFEKRSKTTIKSNKNIVFLRIIADDDSALKASKFTFERFLELCSSLSDLEVQ